jgi:hypothetical protein
MKKIRYRLLTRKYRIYYSFMLFTGIVSYFLQSYLEYGKFVWQLIIALLIGDIFNILILGEIVTFFTANKKHESKLE